MECWLLRAAVTSNRMPTWSRDATPLPQAWLSTAVDHGVALRSSRSTKQLEAYFVTSTTGPVFTVGRATSTDGVQWSAPKTVWSSDEARLPPSPPLSLKQFTALSSCSLLELRYSERGLEGKTHRVGPKFGPASGL